MRIRQPSVLEPFFDEAEENEGGLAKLNEPLTGRILHALKGDFQEGTGRNLSSGDSPHVVYYPGYPRLGKEVTKTGLCPFTIFLGT